jgi:hypothetical protein
VRRLAVLFTSALLLGMELDEPTAIAGLRETLRVAARGAVELTARTDGFFADPAIRIAIPESLRSMTRGLRQIGLRGQIDEFERALNRSAEYAAGEAFDVLAGAIAELRFADARALLGGGDSAATEHLRRSSSEELRARLAPGVARGMRRAGAVQAYERLLQHWRALPQATQPQLDLEDYVAGETLDGLLSVMGAEERRIRSDPGARRSDLLQRVFTGPSGS